MAMATGTARHVGAMLRLARAKVHLILLFLGAFGGVGAGAFTASAQEQAYWLRNGGKVVGTCPAGGNNEPLKAANRSLNGWLLITGLVECRDENANYTFEFRFLRVAINPRAHERIVRPVLNFDWLG